MFEIRIICDPTDADAITKGLAGTFTTSPPLRKPTRSGKRLRLYITADHHTGDDAYADAPPIVHELADLTDLISCYTDAGLLPPSSVEREFLLRRAALLDRMAIEEAAVSAPVAVEMAVETAEAAALTLSLFDRVKGWAGEHGPEDRLWARTSHRGYVRQEYAAWLQSTRP
ncbi:hypothetical protein EKH77_17420 [Streptomyces luteoverticillatus]|uniref:Uncharacterized protein n=1 Tax=Streptomyces luteoverticillatus TaxID=66425 RepID=A0A3S9PKB5_STRLT|nr:hypothetical protein [Streptomyces luteoverticillatus]AZQ72764.1 hypothetical protein EKH77_17420 [Streptomyces luteoverticillatus]